MPDKGYWEDQIRSAARKHGVESYGLLYGPWERLNAPKAVFLSLNPGAPSDEPQAPCVQDVRGNTYEVEACTTNSPLTYQFLCLCEFLKLKPRDVLAGVISPFSSGKWLAANDPARGVQDCSVKLGRRFWTEALPYTKTKLVIACSNHTIDITLGILGITGNSPVMTTNAGWGRSTLRRYRAGDIHVVSLPHLSRYKLFSRPQCTAALHNIFEGLPPG